MSNKDHLLREARKLINVLDTWGNVFVHPIPGKEFTTAHDRLIWVLSQLRNDYGITTQEALDTEIKALNDKEPTHPRREFKETYPKGKIGGSKHD